MSARRLRRWLAWGTAGLLLVVGLSRLRFEVDVLELLPTDLRVVEGLKRHQERFADEGELVITLESADPETTDLAAAALAEALQAAPGLVRRVEWRSSWEDDPEGSAQLLAFLWLNQSPGEINGLTQRLEPSRLKETFRDVREELATSLSPDALGRLAYDPLRLSAVPTGAGSGGGSGWGEDNLLASADGRFRLMLVRTDEPIGAYRRAAAWLAKVEGVVQDWRGRRPELAAVEVGFTGQPAFNAEIGGGMERDLVRSVTGVFLFIALLFWWVHRTWRPLGKLLVVLNLILAATLALGGLAFGTLNVVSAGFAAMLLALAVDFGLVLYQESRISPHSSSVTLRRALGPGIWWAAATTAGAFLAAGLAHLPGLVEMGLLVGMGILMAAAIMIHLFLPWAHRPAGERHSVESEAAPENATPRSSSAVLWLTGALALPALALLATGLPRVDSGTEALNPTQSRAFAAAQRIHARLGQSADPVWVMLAAPDDALMRHRLGDAAAVLERAVAEGELSRYQVPLALWPELGRQRANREQLVAVLPADDDLRVAAEAAGFNERSLALCREVFRCWREAASATDLWWPTRPLARETLARVIDRSATPFHALALAYPGAETPSGTEALVGRFEGVPGAWVTSWDLLGRAVAGHVRHDLLVIVPTVAALLMVTLSLTFRRTQELLLGLAALALSLAMLQAVMRLAGWSWNLMNFIALPVLLGTGVDYGIHIQLALRRHAGNLAAVRRGVGRALLLCAATTLAGFGSLAFSSNEGLASLGRLCATGMTFVVLTTVFLLPHWWLRWEQRASKLRA